MSVSGRRVLSRPGVRDVAATDFFKMMGRVEKVYSAANEYPWIVQEPRI